MASISLINSTATPIFCKYLHNAWRWLTKSLTEATADSRWCYRASQCACCSAPPPGGPGKRTRQGPLQRLDLDHRQGTALYHGMDRNMDRFSAVQKGADALLKGIYHGTPRRAPRLLS